jgi:hypothetical protein
VLAREGAIVVAPHLLADLDGFFQHLEPLREVRKGKAQALVLALEPRCADPSQARPHESTSRPATCFARKPGFR